MNFTKKYTFSVLRMGILVSILAPFGAPLAQAETPVQIAEWMQAHNSYRTLHATAGIIWSPDVAKSAQAYADSCPTGHSSGSGYGENLAFASYDMGRSAVVKLWYDEEEDYDYSNPGFSSGIGHFTQLVWKGTTEIGCGFRSGCSGEWPNIWVCQYNPPGNVSGQFAENVSPPAYVNQPPDSGEPPPADKGSLVPVSSLLFLQE